MPSSIIYTVLQSTDKLDKIVTITHELKQIELELAVV